MASGGMDFSEFDLSLGPLKLEHPSWEPTQSGYVNGVEVVQYSHPGGVELNRVYVSFLARGGHAVEMNAIQALITAINEKRRQFRS